MKSRVFAKRVAKEILRDPLSYIFCLGFPILMLLIMSVVDNSIPAQADMTVFHIYNLAPGMAYFGLTFVMLFTSIQVSKDRSTALLLRLYASPMKAIDFAIGYTIPMLVLGMVQIIICFAASYVVGLIRNYNFVLTQMLMSVVLLLPSLLMFVALGVLFGSAVSEKSAPGLCSVIISAVGMVGGIWMDVDGLGGAIKTVAQYLPFYYGVKLSRLPFNFSNNGLGCELILTLGSAVLFYGLAIIVFTSKMKKDKN